jgi:LAO/AO transport system kinase
LTGRVSSSDLAARVAKGERAATARLISRCENGEADARSAIGKIYRLAGHAHVIGVTGVAGCGKSTLVGKLIERLRANGRSVGVIAIDPSSPYSGGAILGDRIRMSELAGDPGVFIRSMATHGSTGGMAHATLDAIDILDVAGFNTIVIETVGVGQDEVEIAKASHTTIVVTPPGLGDEIQAMKAGILEIADIHVVSKCDRSDADRAITDLKQMLMLTAAERPLWMVPVIATSALDGTGLEALTDAITQHRAVALESQAGRDRRQTIAQFRLRKIAEKLLLQRFAAAFAEEDEALAARLMRGDSDPYSLAAEFLEGSKLRESHGADDEPDARCKIA